MIRYKVRRRGAIAALLGCVLCCGKTTAADTNTEPRPIESAYTVQAGSISVVDTYLSPLQYTGEHISISGHWQKAMPADPKHLLMNIHAVVEADFARSAAGSNLYTMGLDFNWNVQYKWQVAPRLRLSAGGGAGMYAGCLYLPRNSNNPASARASIDITLNGEARWSTHIGRLPILVTEQVALPSAGVFFSPQYGESYYEIYLGNHSGLAHIGWWGNHFAIRNILSADLRFGRCSLRVGYELNVRNSWVCNINTRQISHAAVVGISF